MNTSISQNSEEIRDLNFFLRRLYQVEYLPELENSHTAMSSTWDRKGGNADGDDFKRLEGDRNILLDVDGPGCIHRIFTGSIEITEGTRIRIVLDNHSTPVFDMEVKGFFDFERGPLPYPLVFHKTYPGTLFPIPFSRHCLVELYNPQKTNWGNFWQVTYSIYTPETNVKTLQWPLSQGEKEELQNACDAWLLAESTAPQPPARWTADKKLSIDPGGTAILNIEECGVIREMCISAGGFGTNKSYFSVRMGITWDDGAVPSVDVPLGYFFGNGNPESSYAQAYFSSLMMSLNGNQDRSFFPMPFERKALFEFKNMGTEKVEFDIKLDVQKLQALPKNWGKFHATWTQEYVQSPFDEKMRKFGPLNVPTHVTLERNEGPGKYVGVFLYVHWPDNGWWGEGDWQIWTDEEGWPPSYHGTGSEEYFNSGWCRFDRKAISGVVYDSLPGDVAVYSFHMNDAFQFQKNIRVAVEVWPWNKPLKPATWGSTSFWYALPAQDAQSRKEDILSVH